MNKKFIYIILVGLIIYYIIPNFALSMSEEDANNYAGICVIFINSIYVLVSSILLTKYFDFKWYYPFTIIVLFIPSVFLYFNHSSVYYTLLYGIEYFIGCSTYIKYKM